MEYGNETILLLALAYGLAGIITGAVGLYILEKTVKEDEEL